MKADKVRASWGRYVFAGVLCAYAAGLWVWRPLTPFEWDEILFLRALDHYDVAAHAPHPPGYPLYVGLGKVVRTAVGDPVVSLQLLSIVAAVVALALTRRMAKQLGAPAAAGFAALGVLAVAPTFLFHANVGFSDLPGVACALAATVVLLGAAEHPALLPFAGGVTALAAAIRPQLVVALLPAAVAALVQSFRERRWGRFAGALATFAAVSFACWLPAILVTGVARYWRALQWTVWFVGDREASGRLPGAPLGPLLHHWFVAPWLNGWLAAAFWLLVVAGAVMLWRSGARRLVILMSLSGLSYLVGGLFGMHMAEAPRYVLPALPYFAVLAGGVLAATSRHVRAISLALVTVASAAGLVILAPDLDLRRREPAPAWACLTKIAREFDPRTTTVVWDIPVKFHADYLLGVRGFRLEENRAEIPWAWSSYLPGGTVLFVTSTPRADGTIVLSRAWQLGGMRPLTRRLYDSCAVTRARHDNVLEFSPSFHAEENFWELAGSGSISLPAEAPMQVLAVFAGDDSLRARAGSAPWIDVPAHEARCLPLAAHRSVEVEAVGGRRTHLPPAQLLAVRDDDWAWLAGSPGERELVVPAVARTKGGFETVWVSDVVIRNPDARSQLTVDFALFQQRSGQHGVHRAVTVAPGAIVLLRDVVGALFAAQGSGLLRLTAERPFRALWSTYRQRMPHTLSDPTLERGLAALSLAPQGHFADLPQASSVRGARSNVGFFNPTDAAIELRLELGAGATIAPTLASVRLEAGEFRLIEGRKLLGTPSGAVPDHFTLRFVASAPVFAFATSVEGIVNRSRYLFQGEVAGAASRAGVVPDAREARRP